MAKTKQNVAATKSKIEDTKGGNFGGYHEDHGGGTPVNGGGRGEWTRRGRPGHRVEQPRTDDGKFTYNSANGKGLSSGPSRGKTVNPVLTGGENGIYIDDVIDKKGKLKKGIKTQFEEKSGDYWEKYKDDFYQEGDKIVLAADAKTRIAAKSIWEVAKVYNTDIGEFQERIGGDKKNPIWGTSEGENFAQVKKGRKNKEEKDAVNTAKTTGKEAFVKDAGPAGGIQSGKKWQKKQPTTPVSAPTPQPKKPTVTPTAQTKPSQPVTPVSAPVQQPVSQQPTVSAGSGTTTQPQLKRSTKQLEGLRTKLLAKAQGDSNKMNKIKNLTPAQLDTLYDKVVKQAQ